MSILAVIPVRSGSVRVPHKNLRELMGVPLLAYPILAAKGSRHVSRVVVSTDSPEYAEMARKYGAETPFLRPTELAEDVPSELVLRHAVETLEKYEGYHADPIVLMQASTPLTSTEDLDGCIDLFRETGADTVITVREVKEHPRWMFHMDDGKELHSYIGLKGEYMKEGWGDSKRHTKLMIPTGGAYILKRSVVMEQGRIYGDDLRGYEVPFERGIDIDEEIDFKICEALME